MQDKKKRVIEWMTHPVSKLYYDNLWDAKKNIETLLLQSSRNNFVKNNIKRQEDEINLHTQLTAIETVLADLTPSMDFIKYCKQNNLELEEVKEEYEMFEIGADQKTKLENPLDNFINNLTK